MAEQDEQPPGKEREDTLWRITATPARPTPAVSAPTPAARSLLAALQAHFPAASVERERARGLAFRLTPPSGAPLRVQDDGHSLTLTTEDGLWALVPVSPREREDAAGPALAPAVARLCEQLQVLRGYTPLQQYVYGTQGAGPLESALAQHFGGRAVVRDPEVPLAWRLEQHGAPELQVRLEAGALTIREVLTGRVASAPLPSGEGLERTRLPVLLVDAVARAHAALRSGAPG